MKLLQFILALICLLVAAGMVGCSPKAEAPNPPSQGSQGLVEKLTIEELTARADSISVGKVTNIACYQEDGGNIYTQVTLSVEQTIKGETEDEVVIRVAGGEVDGQTLWVEDAPNFQLAERAVFFLEEREGIFSVVGGFQGKFAIDINNMVSGKLPLSQFSEQLEEFGEQLAEIYQQKQALTPAQRKIDSSIIQVIQHVKNRLSALAEGEKPRLRNLSTALLKIDDVGNIEVKLNVTSLSDEQFQELEALGMQIGLTLPEYGVIEGSLPYDQVEAAAGLDFVVRVGTPGYPRHNQSID